MVRHFYPNHPFNKLNASSLTDDNQLGFLALHLVDLAAFKPYKHVD
jgi:hypothetical protein